MARIIELIITDELRGTGKKENIFRRCTQLFTKSGELIAEHDPCGESYFYPRGLEAYLEKLLPDELEKINKKTG